MRLSELSLVDRIKVLEINMDLHLDMAHTEAYHPDTRARGHAKASELAVIVMELRSRLDRGHRG